MTRKAPVSEQSLQTILPLEKLRIFVYYRLTFWVGIFVFKYASNSTRDSERSEIFLEQM